VLTKIGSQVVLSFGAHCEWSNHVKRQGQTTRETKGADESILLKWIGGEREIGLELSQSTAEHWGLLNTIWLKNCHIQNGSEAYSVQNQGKGGHESVSTAKVMNSSYSRTVFFDKSINVATPL
jgi:hypothetical protein